MRRTKVGLVGILVSVMVASGTGLAPGSAQAQTVDPSLEACPDDRVPAGAFDDVPAGTAVGRATDCLADLRLANGVGPRSFGPAGVVTRAQLVLLLGRVAALGQPGPLDFSRADLRVYPDLVPDELGPELSTAILTLSGAGVVGGRADGSFGLTAGVTRAQVALFLTRLHESLGAAPLPVGTSGPDSDDSDYDDLDGLSEQARTAIAQLSTAGIVQGVGPGRFAPSAGVSRQQMSLLLTRFLQVEVAAGAVSSDYAPAGARPYVLSRFPQLREAPLTPALADQGPGEVLYVVAGLAPGVSYTAALLPADQEQGTFRAAMFTDADGDGTADAPPQDGPGTVTRLETVEGGTTSTADLLSGTAPTTTFTADTFRSALLVVRGTGSAGAVRLAISPTEGGLALQPDQTAAVPVGLGGRLTWSDRDASDPPKVLSAVGRDDPAGDLVVVTFDKPVASGGSYLLAFPPADEEPPRLREVSGGGTTEVLLRTERDLTSAEQGSYAFTVLGGRTLAGEEVVFGAVSLDLSDTS